MHPRAKLLVAARCRLLVWRLLAAVVLGASLAVHTDRCAPQGMLK
jgi:hypothetical protein